MFQGIIPFAHSLLKNTVQVGEYVIDATCGNGNDTLFLSELVGENGHVFAFDIQKEAIEQTKKKAENYHHITYILDSHANVDTHIPPDKHIAGAIFNLGYLPKGDKTIITKPDSTILAVEKILNRLRVGGVIVVVVYAGHPGGQEEKNAVLQYVSEIDQLLYTVLQYQFINMKNNPPFVIAIGKK